METRLGIFHSISEAEQTVEELVRRDIPSESIFLLSSQSPGTSGTLTTSQPETSRVPSYMTPEKSDMVAGAGKAPGGAGKSSGEAIGAAIGGTAGFTAGATVASFMVPGLGMIFAIGLGAAALLGLGGAAAGAGVGNEIEKNVDMGIPQDQVESYRQLLRQGKSLVIAKVRSGAEITTVQEVFRRMGSEDAEAARLRADRAA